MDLKTTHWTAFATDVSNVIGWTLKVTNRDGNPGPIDVRYDKKTAADNYRYSWDLPVGSVAEFDILGKRWYDLWISASDIDGTYSIKATD